MGFYESDFENDAPYPKEQANKIRCLTCQELIRIGAKKCIHCDSFQDWRRHLTVSTAILALIVSLLAGIPAVFPFVREAWRKSDSKLEIASVSSVQNRHIRLLMTNSGKKAGTADFLQIALPIEDSRKTIYFHLDPKDANSNLIAGDSTKVMDFAAQFPANYIDNSWNPSLLSLQQLIEQQAALDKAQEGAREGECKVEVLVTSFQGKTTPLGKSVDCRAFKDLIRQYWDDVPHSP